MKQVMAGHKLQSLYENICQNNAIMAKQRAAEASSPPVSGKQTLHKKLKEKTFIPRSPRKKLANKVFVMGTTNGIILLRTEKGNSPDDAFTYTFQQRLENEAALGTRLNIQKVVYQRLSAKENVPKLQTNEYPSIQFLSINEPEANTPAFRRSWAELIVAELNATKWQYAQTFLFAGDETLMDQEDELGKMDCYMLNKDIAGVVSKYIYENVDAVLNDPLEVANIFGDEENHSNAAEIPSSHWNSWNVE
jgi:hypothetical protein